MQLDQHQISRRKLLTSIGSAALVSACAPGFSARSAQQAALHYSSLASVSQGIRSGELSPVALTDSMLDRIDRLDDELHSFITIMADQARAAARKAEQELLAGNYRGPLHGVPIAVKDLCYTSGIPTTGGHSFLRDFTPDYDATVVTRLRDAGAIILGKLNLTEGAMIGYHPDFDIPVNPWDSGLTTSGSSSGSGVATAAGLCFAAIGTDTGGSIRFPSLACGVVGLKPTYGRVSRHGVLTLADSLDHVGPMARRVEDVALMFEVLAGVDSNDETTLSDPVPDMSQAIGGGVRGMRIGFDRAYADNGVDPELLEAIEKSLEVLDGLGAEIVDVEIPEFTPDLGRAWVTICTVEAARAHAEYYPARADQYGAFFRDWLAFGRAVSDTEYARASALRDAYSRTFIAALELVDAVACPAGGVPSPSSGDVGYGTLDLYDVIGGSPWVRYTYPADFAGTPTITLPCGANRQGVPYALQFMGSKLSEPRLCRIAHAYEEATDWHRRHPPV